jgi:hypothetical protein
MTPTKQEALAALGDFERTWEGEAGKTVRDYIESTATGLDALAREALDRSVDARVAELRLREHHPDNSIQTEHWRRLDMVDIAEALRTKAVDALLAARAGEKT